MVSGRNFLKIIIYSTVIKYLFQIKANLDPENILGANCQNKLNLSKNLQKIAFQRDVHVNFVLQRENVLAPPPASGSPTGIVV